MENFVELSCACIVDDDDEFDEPIGCYMFDEYIDDDEDY